MTADDHTITPRHDWTRDQIHQLLNRPFMDLLYLTHRFTEPSSRVAADPITPTNH